MKTRDEKPNGTTEPRDMTDAEQKEMMGGPAPEGYAKASAPESPAAPQAHAPGEKVAPKTDQKAVPPAAPAAPVAPAPEAAEDPKVDMERIERELAKPEGKEDLTGFTKREKAYYSQMRRDRKRRQDAEARADVLEREVLKMKNPPPPPPDPLEGVGDEDVLTGKELRERLKKMPPAAKLEPEPTAPKVDGRQKRYLELCEKEAREARQDFDEVMELADELIATDSEALKDIGRKVDDGENPAIAMYEAIKKHKDFENLFPAAQTRVAARKTPAASAAPASHSAPAAPATPAVDPAKLNDAQRAQEALEVNGKKTKTTAHVSSREGKPSAELSIEEIAKMSDLEFARLPKATRDRFLREYGSEPAPTQV